MRQRIKFSFINLVRPRGTKTRFEDPSRHKHRPLGVIVTDDSASTKQINLDQ